MGNYSCAKCGTKSEKIIVHHKDFTKHNHELFNLIPLCEPCHRIKHIENKEIKKIINTVSRG